MRSLLLGMGLMAAALGASVQPGEAAQRQFCLSGNKANGGMPECTFYTWEQCRASVAGSDSCFVNPWYAADQQQGRTRPSQRRQTQRY